MLETVLVFVFISWGCGCNGAKGGSDALMDIREVVVVGGDGLDNSRLYALRLTFPLFILLIVVLLKLWLWLSLSWMAFIGETEPTSLTLEQVIGGL